MNFSDHVLKRDCWTGKNSDNPESIKNVAPSVVGRKSVFGNRAKEKNPPITRIYSDGSVAKRL
jgi:hypothetical protein